MEEKLAEISQEAQDFGLLCNMLTIVNSDNVDLKIIVIIQIIWWYKLSNYLKDGKIFEEIDMLVDTAVPQNVDIYMTK